MMLVVNFHSSRHSRNRTVIVKIISITRYIQLEMYLIPTNVPFRGSKLITIKTNVILILEGNNI